MKEIANLARTVLSRRLAGSQLMDFESKKPNKEERLLTLLMADPDTTPLQGVKALYGRNTPANHRALRQVASRLQTKLLNQLYFLDHSDHRHLVSRRYEMECLEMLHQATILYSEGEYTLTERLLKKCLQLAEEADFTQYAVQAAQMLRTIYSEQRQPTHYEAMAKTLLQLQEVQALEQEGDRIYADTRQALANTVVTKQAVLPKLPGYIERLEELHRKAKTFNTFNFLYQLRLAYEELRGDYAAIIEIATMAAERLEDGRLNARRFDRRLNHFVMIYAHLQTRQSAKGLALANEYAHSFHTTSSNWLYFHEHHWLLAMHAGAYQTARLLLEQATDSLAFSKLREAARQRWELYEVYLDFVLPPAQPTAAQRRQREQLILTLPEYSRDKRGHNVAILIMQLLHFLRQKDLEEVLVRTERLRKYRLRYLRETPVVRTRLFLRLLDLAVECGFQVGRLQAQAQPWLDRLRAMRMPGAAYAEIEIIPYESLWAVVIGLLRAWGFQGQLPPRRPAPEAGLPADESDGAADGAAEPASDYQPNRGYDRLFDAWDDEETPLVSE